MVQTRGLFAADREKKAKVMSGKNNREICQAYFDQSHVSDDRSRLSHLRINQLSVLLLANACGKAPGEKTLVTLLMQVGSRDSQTFIVEMCQ